MRIDEQYSPQPIEAGGTYLLPFGKSVAGFLCTIDGTLTVYNGRGNVVVDTLPVTAGVYHPVPFTLGSEDGGKVELGGGAAGTLAVV
ncbi:MAG: hypothetical protein WC423_16145 [Vulcanimicrobiota bacterium]